MPRDRGKVGTCFIFKMYFTQQQQKRGKSLPTFQTSTAEKLENKCHRVSAEKCIFELANAIWHHSAGFLIIGRSVSELPYHWDHFCFFCFWEGGWRMQDESAEMHRFCSSLNVIIFF